VVCLCEPALALRVYRSGWGTRSRFTPPVSLGGPGPGSCFAGTGSQGHTLHLP
jgi:hypothetical protein